jgi:hypothetical protein
MLKISPEKIAKPLLIIFNKSLQQSKYPSNWKSAHVIAIFKKGDTSLPSECFDKNPDWYLYMRLLSTR